MPSEVSRGSTYDLDGNLTCDTCHKKIATVQRKHWEKMLAVIARGETPYTDTLTLAATLRHHDNCQGEPSEKGT